jgi:hypothetical protein
MSANKNSGFRLPPPKEGTGQLGNPKPTPGDTPAKVPTTPITPAAPAAPTTTTTTAPAGNPPLIQIGGDVRPDTSSRDMAIGAGVLVVLFIAFFFAKKAYSDFLVSRKNSPSRANGAGWWLFILLSSLATAAMLGIVNQAKFLNLLYVGPLMFIALVALVLMILNSRK